MAVKAKVYIIGTEHIYMQRMISNCLKPLSKMGAAISIKLQIALLNFTRKFVRHILMQE
jgi:hypothetical protein